MRILPAVASSFMMASGRKKPQEGLLRLSSLERKTGHQSALPGLKRHRSAVYRAKVSAGQFVCTGLRGERICRHRIVEVCPVEDVRKLRPNLEVIAAFLAHAEVACKAHAFGGAAAEAIFAVV